MKFKNSFWLILFLVGATVAMLAGQAYWLKNKEKYLNAGNRAQSFILLDEDKNLFHSESVPAGKKFLLIFIPDLNLRESVRPVGEFFQSLYATKLEHVVPLVFTRGNLDEMGSFRRAIGFKGRFLLDPSASVARMFGAWPSHNPTKNWCYAYADNKMRDLWTTCGEKPLTLKEMLPYLE